jgi:dTDP-4-amino-4,6-dideoxygalactose transaminase
VLSAISRYGARFPPDADDVVARCRRRGELVRGPHIAGFEEEVARRLGAGRAVTTSYGRVAFLYLLQALGLPPGSEIVFPALTFWVMPEMARVAGLQPVFADVDPCTMNMDPASLERVLSPRTRAVVPTHLYGRPCDMYEILCLARRRGLRVIEDCAHALGATYRGREVGSFGDAAIFSFQILKPLNTLGGGLVYASDRALGHRLAALQRADPWPAAARVERRLRLGRLERALIAPRGFTLTGFPLMWALSFTRARPDVYMWEKVRPLHPLPAAYRERYSNVQAALGLSGLEHLDEWTREARDNADSLTRALAGVPGVGPPADPADRVHVYYQYSVYVPDRDATVRACLRRGLDVEYHHMDVCPDLPLFAGCWGEARGARRTTGTIQLPVHPALSARDVDAVARRARDVLARLNGPPRAHPAAVA